MKKENNSKSRNSTKLITFKGKEIKLLRYQGEWVFPAITDYVSGLGSPIAMELYSYNIKENGFELYTDVTVNIPHAKREAGCQFIDTNNNSFSILDWLEENDFGKCTGNTAKSGFCTYPEFNFYAGKQFMEYKAINDKINIMR